MTGISFSYQHASGETYELQATFLKKMGKHKKEDLEKAVKQAADKFITKSKSEGTEIKGTLDIQMTTLAKAKVRETGKKWSRISLGEEKVTQEEATLQRTMLTSEELEALESPSTRLGKALSRAVETIRSFFYFITGIPRKPSVDMALLQEVIGAFPQDGKVRMDQALAYWTRALEKEAIPSAETKKLLRDLKACGIIGKKIALLQSLHGRSLDRAYESLSARLLRSIKKLKEDERVLVPAGFWRGVDGKEVFQDCLLEIKKTKDNQFSLSLFSTEEGTSLEKGLMIAENAVSQQELDRNIPLILALNILPSQGGKELRLKDVLGAIFSEKMRERLEKDLGPKHTVTTTSKELEAIFGSKAQKVVPGAKASPYKSAARLAKVFIHHEMGEADKDLEYKIVKLRGEIVLLQKATVNDTWLPSAEYRDTVYRSALKLLSDISGVKKGGFFEQLVEKKQVKENVLEEETRELEKILDKVSSYAAVQVKKSAEEPLQKSAFCSVQITPTFLPPETNALPVTALSGVDISPLILASKPKTIQEAKEYLATASSFCENLVKQGKYDVLESCVPLIYSQLSLEAADGTAFLKNIPLDQVDAFSQSIATLQKSVSACMLANVDRVYHSDYLLAIPFFEAMHHQVLVGAYGKDIPYFEGRALIKELTSESLSYCRSVEGLRVLRELQNYHSDAHVMSSHDKHIKAMVEKVLGAPQKEVMQIMPPDINEFKEYFEKEKREAILNAQKAAFLNYLTKATGCKVYRPFGTADLQKDALMCTEAEQRWGKGPGLENDIHIARLREQEAGRRVNAYRVDEHPSLPQGAPMSKLPDVKLNVTEVPGISPMLVKEFYVDAFDMTFKPNQNTYDKRPGEVEQGYRMYSPTTLGSPVYSRKEYKPEVFTDGFGVVLQHFAGNQSLLVGGSYEAYINEFEFYTKKYAFGKSDVKLSADEVRAIQTLSPNPAGAGANEAAVANLLKLATYHPRLLSVPQVRLFIYRTILRPGVMDTELTCTSMKEGINALLERIDTLRETAKKTSAYADEIYLTALLGTLAARIPESKKNDFPVAKTNWLEEMNTMRRELRLPTTLRNLLQQEYLGVILANGLVHQDLSTTEIGDIVSAWVGINTPGAFAHFDPGIQKEAKTLILSLLPLVQKMTDQEKASILSRCAQGLPQGGWDFTDFPSCKNGDIVVVLDTGALWKEGKISGKLPSEIEDNAFFEKVGLKKKQIWNVSQAIDKKANRHVFVYSSDTSPYRILCTADGVHFSIQKKIGGAWYNAEEPVLQRETKQAQPEMGAGVGWLAKIARRLMQKQEEKKKQEPAVLEWRNDITLPLSLYQLSQGKVVYVEAGESPKKMFLEAEDGQVTIDFSKEGEIAEVHSDLEKYGGLGAEGTRLFTALDDRIIAKVKGTKKFVSFPHLRLRGSKKQGAVVARSSGNSWEYEDETLKGYKVAGVRQPAANKQMLHAGAMPTIPPGITSYQLLEKEGKQKVLIPMLELEFTFGRHAPGFEPTEEKQFSRFATQVKPKARDNPNEDLSLCSFDVENGRLMSNDPLANAYLAYVYATQQRYEDAKFYLEKSHTNRPEPQLQKLYSQIHDWKDDSSGFAEVRRKALLLQTEWPIQSGSEENQPSKAELAGEVIASFAQTEEQIDATKAYNSLDKKDRIRLKFLVETSKKEEIVAAYQENLVHQGPEIKSEEQEREEQSIQDAVKDFFEQALPKTKPLSSTFVEDIALHPDETIEKYFLSLLQISQKVPLSGEDKIVLETVRNARPRMFRGGRGLAEILLDHPDEAREMGRILMEHHAAKARVKTLRKLTAEEKGQIARDIEQSVGDGTRILDRVLRELPPVPQASVAPQISHKMPLIHVDELVTMLQAKKPFLSFQPPTAEAEKPTVLFTPPPPEPEGEGPKGVSIFSEEEYVPYLKEPEPTKSEKDVSEFFSKVSVKGKAEEERRDLLVKDTAKYHETQGEQRLFDPEKASKVCSQLKAGECTLQKEQAAQRDKILTMVNTVPDSRLEKVKAALTPSRQFVHFERLLGGYTRGRDDLEALLKKYNIQNVDVDALDQELQQYLEVSVKLNLVKDAASKIKKQETFSTDEQREIGAMLQGNRFFTLDTSPRSRLLLMLEYSCGFLLRKGQIEVVDRMLNEPNCIAQLPPGSGKTMVILRLLAIMRANGTNISMLILPEWLEEQNIQDLDRGVKELIDQDIFRLKVPDARDLSYEELYEIHERLLATMQNKSVLATTRTDLLTLRNSFQCLEKQIRKQVEANDPNVETTRKAYAEMGAVIDLLQKKAWALTDEVDSILDIHREVNRKLGGGEKDKYPWQRDMGVKLFSLLLDAQGKKTPLGQLSDAILHNTHVDLPDKVVKDALGDWADELLKALDVKEVREQIKQYLLQKNLIDPKKPVPDLPEGIDKSLKEKLVAAKSFLSQALPLSTLTKANNVKDGYGRSEGRVIPFAGPDQPQENSEFCNPFEMIALTIQDYLYRGVAPDEAFLFAKNIVRQVNQEWMQSGAIPGKKKDCETYKKALSSYGVDIEKLEGIEEEDELAAYVMQCVNKNPGFRLNFCRDLILPNIQTTKEQIRSDNFDLVDMTAFFSGMTGTPYNVDTYHDRISKKGATTLGSDGKALAAIMKHAAETKIFTMQPKEGQSLSGYLAETTASEKYQGIIDIGANLKEKSPEALAMEMAGYLPKEDTKTRYIIYVNRKGQIVAYDRNNKTTLPFDEKTMPIDERKTIYQVFVGVDIKQAPKAKFLVTVGNLNFLKDFIQGALRLRELGLEQSFDIALSPEVNVTLHTLVGKSLTDELSLQDIISYYLKNEVGSGQTDTLAAEKEEIERVPRTAIFRAKVRLSGKKTAKEIAEIEKQLAPWTRQEPDYSVEALTPVQREEKTSKTLDDLKTNTLKKLNDLLQLEIVKNTPELLQEIKNERDKLDKREGTDPSRMPPTNTVQQGGGEIGKTATAVQQQQQQQQATQLAQAVAYEKREAVPSEIIPQWSTIFKEFKIDASRVWQPSKDWQCFDPSILISENIHAGFSSNMYKDLAFAAYDTKTNRLIMLDKTDLNEILGAQQQFTLIFRDLVPLVIGEDVSILKNEGLLPKDKTKYYQQIVQVKLMAGFVDFTSKEEKEALHRFVASHKREDIEAFMEANRQMYLSQSNYQAFKEGKGALAKELGIGQKDESQGVSVK